MNILFLCFEKRLNNNNWLLPHYEVTIFNIYYDNYNFQ